MNTTETIAGLRFCLSTAGKVRQGFVPTMGALHHGHIALVERAVNECGRVTVSIFVNPTQFNDKRDLDRYPRTVDRDKEMLSRVLRENDVVFLPSVMEIYPGEDKRVFDFGNLGRVMEGEYRPGHFNGVAQVVSRLFDIVKPDVAYFGEKDFQQLAVIKALAEKTGQRVEIVGCPTVRESDGLAMSSRNALLTPEHRAAAPVIYHAMLGSQNLFLEKGKEAAREFFTGKIGEVDGFRVQYYEITDDTDLVPADYASDMIKGRNYHICVAVYAGGVRLIDNVRISLE
ncbi:MAG: pantoate--beta-alanine ligase [Bacteroidetes bacterium]|nr:pantoate--beta-alanine ligase [Bacteroidota bacterium]